MPQPRTYQTEAVIIHKIKLGEADRILAFFTPHRGKLRAVAKGVRRPRSKLSGHLELLTHSLITLAHGRNLDTIIGSQTINSYFTLKSDLDLSASSLYIAELIDQFASEHAENYTLFQLLLTTLNNLCEAGNHVLTRHYFEMHLLTAVGYRPQLRQCVSCHQPLEPVINNFSVNAGGVLCPACNHNVRGSHTISVNALKVLRLLQGERYDIVRRLKINPSLSLELRRTISNYIEYLLEREVKSASFLDSLRRA